MTTNNLQAASSATQVTRTFETWWIPNRNEVGFYPAEKLARLAWSAALEHSPEVRRLREENESLRGDNELLRSSLFNHESEIRELKATSPSVSSATPWWKAKFMSNRQDEYATKGGKVCVKIIGQAGRLLIAHRDSDLWAYTLNGESCLPDGTTLGFSEGFNLVPLPEPANMDGESEAEAGNAEVSPESGETAKKHDLRSVHLPSEESPASSPSEGVSQKQPQEMKERASPPQGSSSVSRLFRKKPVVIEAVQLNWRNWSALCDFVGDVISGSNPAFYGPASDTCGEPGPEYINLQIPTLEGTLTARHGDWIVKGNCPKNGAHLWPVKPEYFAANYEPAIQDAHAAPVGKVAASPSEDLTELGGEK